MTVKNGAALIHCRTKYCDFPGKMFQYPADFTPAELYGFRTMILQTTREAEELRQTHRFRCVVIASQKHIVLGVTGYLNDMLKEAGRCYEDEGGRPVCGFFGLSWKREEMPVILADGFPSLESFCAVVRRWVLPRWEARYWQQPQASEYDMEAELIPFSEREKEIRGKWQRANVFRDRLKIYPPDQGEQLLQQVMAAAVKENRAVSGCTGFTGAAAAVRSSFMNVSCGNTAGTDCCAAAEKALCLPVYTVAVRAENGGVRQQAGEADFAGFREKCPADRSGDPLQSDAGGKCRGNCPGAAGDRQAAGSGAERPADYGGDSSSGN